MSDDAFLSELEACNLPEDHFHHVDHLRAAWLCLNRLPTTDAIAKLSAVLRSYTASLGRADRYHETITWAFLLLVNERMQRSAQTSGWDSFATANQDLFDWKNSILSRYYREETLQSELARKVFVMPDRF